MISKQEIEAILKANPFPGFKEQYRRKAEPPKVVTLASSNPEVPLERQRERISEAQQRLREDEERKLREWEEKKRKEKWLLERQMAIDFWMEQRIASEEAERRFRRELDPTNSGICGAAPFHRGGRDD
jgi:hypothetical protein